MIIHNNLRISWYYDEAFSTKARFNQKQTICTLDISDMRRTATAYCKNTKEFNKEEGRKISLTRVLKDNGIEKEVRAAIWEKYRLMTKVPRWSKKDNKKDNK